MPDAPFLVADIGATNARFGLIGVAGIGTSRILNCADYPSLDAAATAFLAAAAPRVRPRAAAIAVAGPITGDRFAMTNNPWTFSISATRRTLGLDRLELVNDFTAVALSIPYLEPGDRQQIGDGAPEAGRPIGVIGPGSGLGVSALIPGEGGWTALATEGGHVTMAPADEREARVLDCLRRRFAHVSAERVISGMGLVNLYDAVLELDGHAPGPVTPADVTESALTGGVPAAREALEMFCAMLGTVAGNLALTLGARGGVYIAGGIVPRLGEAFARSRFRQRFIEKGRMEAYLGPIPTYVVTHKLPAFLGLKSLLDRPAPRPDAAA